MTPRPRRRRTAALLLAAVALAGCGAGAAPGSPDGAGSTEPAAAAPAPPAFTATTLGGDVFDSAAEFADSPTVLWFWAPWCTICRAEAPEVLAVADELAGDVRVVGVAGRGAADEMRDFVDDTGTGALDHVVDADGSIWSAYGVVAQPAFAFVSTDGRAEVFNGALPTDDLREAARALAEG